MNITVYCGSKNGDDPDYTTAAMELGVWIADNGHTLVYGGGNIGLMGVLADTVLGRGGSVIGVIPEFLMVHEKGHEGDFTLEVVPNMQIRKGRMLELGDVYIAMPGGVGTLDEIAEAMSLRRLDRHSKPCIFYNINGYYELMRAVLKNMVDHDFLDDESLEAISFAKDTDDVAAIVRRL